ncbi:MAG: beta-galactosidase, partial [Acetobacteraceae bacterium]|nr:beta-galactosidase [Acetobacteraceae bacterium]
MAWGWRRLAALVVFASSLSPALAQPPTAHWPDYEIILWHRQPHTAYAGLPRLGYSGALVNGRRAGIDEDAARADSAPLIAAGLRWYVENIATDFYSNYHRWEGPDRPVNWRYLELQRRYRENPRDPALFLREPSLSDPDWIARIRARLAAHARVHAAIAAPGRPFFLNLADEPGIADLSAFWDFDFSPHSLAGFRAWLRGEYPSLAALNAQWGTAFADWDAVLPETTDAALARTDGNLSAWSDFREWMDIAFARAVRAGRDAVSAEGSGLLAAIAGGQRAGWGGWNYGVLAPQVDVLEGGELALASAFHPGLVTVSTSFAADAREWHRLWRQVLHGARGTIIWDGSRDVVTADGEAGPRGLASLPVFMTLRGGIPA